MSRRERDLRRLAARHGWQLALLPGGHWVLRGPHGQRVVAARTPGDSGHLRVLEGLRRSRGPQRSPAGGCAPARR